MKPQSHTDITELALEYYKQNNPSKLSTAVKKARFKDALIQGTKDEDSPTVTRGTNWHFYGSNSILKDYEYIAWEFPKIVIRPTSEKILIYRQKSFSSAIKDGATKRLFSTFGRILHHIQDMSTPSHVVPVYHGPIISDKYETFLVEHWSELKERTKDNWSANQRDNSVSDDFIGIYHKGAKRVINFLNSSESSFQFAINNQQKSEQMSYIWNAYSQHNEGSNPKVPFKINGFGKFGPIGEHFGEISFPNDNGKSFHIAHDTYLDIAAKFTLDAVLDSVVALNIFERAVEEQFKNRDFIESANPFLEYAE